MSTNAIIKVQGLSRVCLYKHYDGDPSSTLGWLTEFNSDFEKNRKNDPEYKFAQLIRSSVILQEKYNLDDSKYTGWGVFSSDSVGYDYTYTLKNDGTVLVRDGKKEY